MMDNYDKFLYCQDLKRKVDNIGKKTGKKRKKTDEKEFERLTDEYREKC